MPELYRRAWALEVGSLRIDGRRPDQLRPLDVSFEVEKSTKREPNTFSASIRNLAPEHRAELEGASSIRVSLEAGYEDLISTIFEGDLRDGRSKKAAKRRVDNVDVITELEGEDGGSSYRTATVQRSFAAGTSVSTVLEAAVDALGVGPGNLRELGAAVELEAGGGTYPEGTVLSGQAHREVDRIVRSVGLTWSVQNGNLILRRRNQPVEATAYHLTPRSGLIGSPSKDNEGLISAVALLIPELYPGRRVVLDSQELDAQTYVDRVKYVGDTAGNDWYAELELKEY